MNWAKFALGVVVVCLMGWYTVKLLLVVVEDIRSDNDEQ